MILLYTAVNVSLAVMAVEGIHGRNPAPKYEEGRDGSTALFSRLQAFFKVGAFRRQTTGHRGEPAIISA